MSPSGDVPSRGFSTPRTNPWTKLAKKREDDLVMSMRSPDLHCSQQDQASGMLSACRVEMRRVRDHMAILKPARRRLEYDMF